MADESRALKRSELYTLVWEKAVQRVAAGLDVYLRRRPAQRLQKHPSRS